MAAAGVAVGGAGRAVGGAGVADDAGRRFALCIHTHDNNVSERQHMSYVALVATILASLGVMCGSDGDPTAYFPTHPDDLERYVKTWLTFLQDSERCWVFKKTVDTSTKVKLWMYRALCNVRRELAHIVCWKHILEKELGFHSRDDMYHYFSEGYHDFSGYYDDSVPIQLAKAIDYLASQTHKGLTGAKVPYRAIPFASIMDLYEKTTFIENEHKAIISDERKHWRMFFPYANQSWKVNAEAVELKRECKALLAILWVLLEMKCTVSVDNLRKRVKHMLCENGVTVDTAEDVEACFPNDSSVYIAVSHVIRMGVEGISTFINCPKDMAKIIKRAVHEVDHNYARDEGYLRCEGYMGLCSDICSGYCYAHYDDYECKCCSCKPYYVKASLLGELVSWVTKHLDDIELWVYGENFDDTAVDLGDFDLDDESFKLQLSFDTDMYDNDNWDVISKFKDANTKLVKKLKNLLDKYGHIDKVREHYKKAYEFLKDPSDIIRKIEGCNV